MKIPKILFFGLINAPIQLALFKAMIRSIEKVKCTDRIQIHKSIGTNKTIEQLRIVQENI